MGLAGPIQSHKWQLLCRYVQGHPARTGAEVITLEAVGSPPTVQSVPGPITPRTFASSVVLPTGEVAVFGGAQKAVEFSDKTAVFTIGARPIPCFRVARFLAALRWAALDRTCYLHRLPNCSAKFCT
jgi:hypothetical protein